MIKQCLTAALLVGAATQAGAVTYGADGATATSEFSVLYDAENTIDGSGLSTAGDPGATHATYTTNNHWTTARGETVGESITWSFDNAEDFGGLYLWNHRSNNIANNASYEPVLFDLEVLGDVDTLFSDVMLEADTDTSQAFVADTILTGVTAITFTVKATQNSNVSPFTGLAEVLFDSSNVIDGATFLSGETSPAPIPLPASLPLLAAALGGLGLARRLRR